MRHRKQFYVFFYKAGHYFLEIEKEIPNYAYDNAMAAGLTADEIEIVLANKMFLQN